jgi:hypothetical protein
VLGPVLLLRGGVAACAPVNPSCRLVGDGSGMTCYARDGAYVPTDDTQLRSVMNTLAVISLAHRWQPRW